MFTGLHLLIYARVAGDLGVAGHAQGVCGSVQFQLHFGWYVPCVGMRLRACIVCVQELLLRRSWLPASADGRGCAHCFHRPSWLLDGGR